MWIYSELVFVKAIKPYSILFSTLDKVLAIFNSRKLSPLLHISDKILKFSLELEKWAQFSLILEVDLGTEKCSFSSNFMILYLIMCSPIAILNSLKLYIQSAYLLLLASDILWHTSDKPTGLLWCKNVRGLLYRQIKINKCHYHSLISISV